MKRQQPSLPVAIALFGVLGVILLTRSQAATTPPISLEVENGQRAGPITQVSGDDASNNIFVTTGPSAAPMPAALLDLRNWKLTLPADSDGNAKADEITQPALATYASDAYFHINNTNDGVIFTAPVGGATTSGSSYPRSELREMTNNGADQASWDSTTGSHSMTIRQAITHLPATKQHVVAGQIHDANDDVIMVRLENKRLFIESNGDEIGLLTDNYVLGTEMTITITATAAGIAVNYQSSGRSAALQFGNLKGSGWYFKAGCYTQSNPTTGDDPTDYGQVIIYDLSVAHTP